MQQETVTPFPLERLEKAELQYSGKSTQLVLHTLDGPFYFPINYRSSSPQDQVNQVNAFIQDTAAPSLKLEQDRRWLAYCLALCTLTIGSCSLWFGLERLFKYRADRSHP